MQLEVIGGIILFLASMIPIIILIFIVRSFIESARDTPTTDRIYIWTEQLESSARRLKLQYVSDQNVASRIRTATAEDIALSAKEMVHDTFDPSAEPKLPFGRFDPPQYHYKKLTSLGLELWTKKMHARRDSFNVDKRCYHIFNEAKDELKQIGLTIIDAQETSTGILYAAGIDVSGYDESSKERIIVKIRIYGTKKSNISVVELSVFSRDDEQVVSLLEQIKQLLWQ